MNLKGWARYLSGLLQKLHGKRRLAGAAPARRLKTYSAQSGYAYQYSYQGNRESRSAGPLSESGTEYVFRVSADRRNWGDVSVVVAASAIQAWEQSRGRRLSATERYAVAKIALFQAFDERSGPGQLGEPVRVRNADIEGIVEMLGL